VPAASLVIVGEGPLEDALREQAGRLAIQERVEFVGTLAEAGIAARLTTARALVLPSIDASEAFGLVQLEAMAAGVPVVATDLPTGVPEVGVPGETGFLVPPGDSAALAAALAELQSDGDTSRRLGEAARRRFAGHYARERMIERLLAWYEDVMGRHGTREEVM
jgi:rhamnosyl/mannosyltransferase